MHTEKSALLLTDPSHPSKKKKNIYFSYFRMTFIFAYVNNMRAFTPKNC